MTTNNTNELYIVTGAAGNLGSAIVRNLVSRNQPVRAFVLRGEEAAKHLPKEANVIEGDVTDISSLETLFADIPESTSVYCIHCAAMVSVSNLVAEKIWHVNVDGTQYIIDKCRENHVRLIFIGSTGAIPEQPMGTAIKEVDHYPYSGRRDGSARRRLHHGNLILSSNRKQTLFIEKALPGASPFCTTTLPQLPRRASSPPRCCGAGRIRCKLQMNEKSQFTAEIFCFFGKSAQLLT